MLIWIVLSTIFSIGVSVPVCTDGDDDTFPEQVRIMDVFLNHTDVLLTRSNVSIQSKDKIMNMLRELPKLKSEAELRPLIREGLQLWCGMPFDDKLSAVLALFEYTRFDEKYMGLINKRVNKMLEKNEKNASPVKYNRHSDDMVEFAHKALSHVQETFDKLYLQNPRRHAELIADWKGLFVSFVNRNDFMSARSDALRALKNVQLELVAVECMMQIKDKLIVTAYEECARQLRL